MICSSKNQIKPKSEKRINKPSGQTTVKEENGKDYEIVISNAETWGNKETGERLVKQKEYITWANVSGEIINGAIPCHQSKTKPRKKKPQKQSGEGIKQLCGIWKTERRSVTGTTLGCTWWRATWRALALALTHFDTCHTSCHDGVLLGMECLALRGQGKVRSFFVDLVRRTAWILYQEFQWLVYFRKKWHKWSRTISSLNY